jgi:hypothetical protein
MCVPRQALVSALVRRIRAGYLVSRADLDALLGGGVPLGELVFALSPPDEGDAAAAFAHARRLLDELGVLV